MDSLRLTLLAIGVAFIAVLYLVMRIKSGKPFVWPSFSWPGHFRFFPRDLLRRKRNDELDAGEVAENAYHEDLDDEDLQVLSQMSLQTGNQEIDVAELGGLSAVVEDEAFEGEPLVIVLNVMTKDNRRFAGLDILDALYANDLQHGEMMIFHRYPDSGGSERPIFSLANTVEPGTFNLDTIEQVQTPGLSLFMQLPGPVESRDAFELMLKTGRNLAQQLGGDLCDERRSVLTLQTIGHIKEQIEAFLFRQKMAKLQKHRPDKARK